MNKGTSFRDAFFKEFSFFLAVPAVIWQLLFFCLPLLFIITMSLLVKDQHGYHLSLSYYATFFACPYIKIIGRSLLLAFVTATCSIFLAYPVAYHLIFNVRRMRNALLFFLILPFWTNLLVQVYAWFFVLDTYGLLNSALLYIGIIDHPLHILNTPVALYIVMLYCYLPFMIMPIYSSLEKFDPRLFEASADLGANRWQTFLRVTLPLSAAGIRTGFFLVFVPSFGEFVIPALLGGGKQFYVGSLIAHYFLSARNPHLGSAFTCAAGVVLIGCGVLIFYSFRWFFMRGKQS